MVQDKRGFMWIGTEDGLNRFDGHFFTTYKNIPGNTSCVSGNIITDLYEDNQGILWIATSDGGITRYDYRLPPAQQFRQYRHSKDDVNSIPENGINKIIEDKLDNLWLATSSSFVVRFNKKTEKFDIPVKTGTRAILALAMADKDILLVGRAGGGLMKIDTRSLQYREDAHYNNLYDNLPHASISAIYKDKTNKFWLGSWDDKVYCYLTADLPEIKYQAIYPLPNLPRDEINAFAEDNHQRIWMASKNTGVTVFNYATQHVYQFQHQASADGTIADDHTNAVYVDKKGDVWIGTNNGLNMYNQLFSPFIKTELPFKDLNVTIYDFYKDDSSNLWIATSKGIYIKNRGIDDFKFKEIVYKGEKLEVTSFFGDKEKLLYIGTNYTLFKYDAQSNIITPLPNTNGDSVMKKLISSRIVSVVRDTINNHPSLLVSPYGHYITYYDLKDKKWVSRTDSVQKIIKKYNIKDNLIRKLYTDKEGNTWLATYKAGLGFWQQHNITPIQYYTSDLKNKSSISSNNIYDILEDNKHNFWISTYGGGVNYFNGRQKTFMHLEESSNLTEGMQTDKYGNLWMVCNGHIHKYEPAKNIYSCYELTPLQGAGGVRGYMYKDKEGNLYAAGAGYYICFNPDKVSEIIHEPEIYLTDFKVFDSSMSDLLMKKSIALNHNQNFFTIESAPDYSGDNLFYTYMLEGVDKTWRSVGKENIANYSNLSAGKYRFIVKASNWRDSPVTKYKAIDIIIIPPYWQQWWFYVVLAVVTSLIIIAIYKYRVYIILERQAIRNGIAQDLHDQVGSTLSSISVYGEVAKRYYSNHDEQQLNKILDTISQTANDMILEMADIVWAINPKNDPLHSIITRIENFVQPVCKAKGILFCIKGNARSSDCIVSMAVRKNLYLILKEGINNSVKHSQGKNLDINISFAHELLQVAIKDDGVGFNKDKILFGKTRSLAGNGLDNIKMRAEELHAKLNVESKPGFGTSINLSFKI